MNIGQADRLCRTNRGASQGAVVRQASSRVSSVEILENDKHDPTFSMLSLSSQAPRHLVDLLFFLAPEVVNLGSLDARNVGTPTQSVLASLANLTNANKRSRVQHG
jgi:hypothetical protein